ncbi:MAG: OmpA family protein [Deltaproteobacteria bacterium]|nr:OmpA family protein [Deltaproteobacteria bacterium]
MVVAPVVAAQITAVPQKVEALPADTDGDKVADAVDRCPNTPVRVPVNAGGYPADSDHDGVFDYRDRCKDTVIGASVDADGCQTKLTLHIDFAYDSDIVESRYDSEIAKAAQCIKDYPGNLVYIDGHTDSFGSADYNQNLSLRRARAVTTRLNEKFGISLQCMTARGFGETIPVADSRNPDGRWVNRRVEVICGAHRSLGIFRSGAVILLFHACF